MKATIKILVFVVIFCSALEIINGFVDKIQSESNDRIEKIDSVLKMK